MRTKMNSRQRRTFSEKRNHDAEIREALNNDELPECQICYTPLTSKTNAKLPCEHDYCLECLTTWFKKSRLCGGLSLLPIVEKPGGTLSGEWKFPVYFQNCAVFNCPSCRCEHSFLHQGKIPELREYPQKVIAKVHFGDVFDRDPILPIFDKNEFYRLIPRKYAHKKRNRAVDPFTGEVMEISPLVLIMGLITQGLESGDTDFYLRHAPTSPIQGDVLGDIIVTSKTVEDENPLFKSFKLFDVNELNTYYRIDN